MLNVLLQTVGHYFEGDEKHRRSLHGHGTFVEIGKERIGRLRKLSLVTYSNKWTQEQEMMETVLRSNRMSVENDCISI